MQKRQLRRPIRISKFRFALHTRMDYGGIDQHTILTVPTAQLAVLYGLAAGSFIEWDDDNDQRNNGRIAADFIHLYPRPQGDYANALAVALDQKQR